MQPNLNTKLAPALPLHHFYILLALVRGPAHGYALGAIIQNDSLGGLSLRDGTLYRSLQDLSKASLIADAGQAPAGPSGQPRKYYGITNAGMSVLREEARRYRYATDIATNSGLFADELPEDIRRLLQ
jgi:DNA-binding PadR family transcriptional regulator